MRTEDLELLPLTEYGVPSGNYDGSSDTSFSGNRQKGNGYYRNTSGRQTVNFQTEGLVGTITIQGSLDSNPTIDSDWFDVYEYASPTADLSVTLTGNFAWLRASVSGFTGGTIASVTVTY